MDSVDLRYGLLTQLSTTNRVHDVEGLWSPCIEGRNELSRRFIAEEFGPSLKHKNSAAGPDGWTYSELGRKEVFAATFVEGVHWMATNGTTPESWKRYNSLMLFKKPDEYVPGQNKVLKNFRPIALSKVRYKLLAVTLCKRLSKWLVINKGISYSQRAVFGRHGVSENTLLVGEALKAKKIVLYLDLSDAFKSVQHSIIFEALKQCKCPEWIVNLLKAMYGGCTTPTDVNGKALSGPILVNRGVRQGCPVSSVLFNLVLDPVLKIATTDLSMCIGYKGDLAIVTEDPEQTQVILSKVVETATKLGLTFNPRKCGIANYQEPVEMCGEKIPIVTEDRASVQKWDQVP